MKTILFFTTLVLSFTSFASKSEITATKRSDEAYILRSVGSSTNIGLLRTARGIVLVDPMPGDGRLVALSTAAKDIFGANPDFILNTHEHSDHSGGNAYFVSTGSRLIETDFDSTEIGTTATKSHSSDDKIFFHKPSNTIFVGDIYTTNWHPTFYAGGMSGFVDAIDIILSLGDQNSLIVPGHGKPTSKKELRLFKQSTLEWFAKIEELSQKGMDVGDMQENDEVKRILLKFNLENASGFVPDKALKRFIERTLAVIESGM